MREVLTAADAVGVIDGVAAGSSNVVDFITTRGVSKTIQSRILFGVRYRLS